MHRFKDVRTSILTLVFEDSPTFNNNGASKATTFGLASHSGSSRFVRRSTAENRRNRAIYARRRG
jgi:hypothetical protein